MTTVINSINNNFNSGLFYGVYSGYMNDNPNFFSTASLLSIGTSGTSGNQNTGTVTNIPTITTGTNNFISSTGGNPENFSVQWLGYFKSNFTGTWTFYTNSDDCSYLWIGTNALTGFTTANSTVNNSGAHGPQERSGTVSLTSGVYYPIRIQFGESGGGQEMIVSFLNPTLTKTSNGSGYYFSISNGVLRP